MAFFSLKLPFWMCAGVSQMCVSCLCVTKERGGKGNREVKLNSIPGLSSPELHIVWGECCCSQCKVVLFVWIHTVAFFCFVSFWVLSHINSRAVVWSWAKKHKILPCVCPCLSNFQDGFSQHFKALYLKDYKPQIAPCLCKQMWWIVSSDLSLK